MKIICVMCIHQRKQVTEFVLGYLQKQTIPIEILLIGDSETEFNIARDTGCLYLHHENKPLGKKWQYGISYAWRVLKADVILILGSDDLISHDWCDVGVRYMEFYDYDLVGTNVRYVLRIKKDEPLEIIQKKYPTDRLLGAGRLISRRILDKLDGILFNPVSVKLDSTSSERIQKIGGKIGSLDELDSNILLLKGDWNCMNPWNLTKDIYRIGSIDNPDSWLSYNFPDAIPGLGRL